jgi:hypothetical protein
MFPVVHLPNGDLNYNRAHDRHNVSGCRVSFFITIALPGEGTAPLYRTPDKYLFLY